MLIAEALIDTPMLREALQAAPGVTVDHEERYAVDGDVRYYFWAEGEDVDAFHEALDRDPTVTRPKVLTEAADRRLYRVTTTDVGREVATFPTWGELGLVMLDSRSTHEGWRPRIQVPDRDTLVEFLDVCRDRGLSPTIDAIYHGIGGDGEPGGLTRLQREALVTALEVGYFEVPRGASLADVAERLGVSSQSVSERLRRGLSTLVGTVVAPRVE